MALLAIGVSECMKKSSTSYVGLIELDLDIKASQISLKSVITKQNYPLSMFIPLRGFKQPLYAYNVFEY